MRVAARFLVLAVGMLGLSACIVIPGAPATPQGMTIPPAQAGVTNTKFTQRITVGAVSGGQPTYLLPKVDNASFKKALEDSLAAVGDLAPAGAAPAYTLDANLVTLDQPSFGVTLDVTSTVDYTLSGNGETQHLTVTAAGSATLSDSTSFVKRLRLANERSMRENIEKLVRQLLSDTSKTTIDR